MNAGMGCPGTHQSAQSGTARLRCKGYRRHSTTWVCITKKPIRKSKVSSGITRLRNGVIARRGGIWLSCAFRPEEKRLRTVNAPLTRSIDFIRNVKPSRSRTKPEQKKKRHNERLRPRGQLR